MDLKTWIYGKNTVSFGPNWFNHFEVCGYKKTYTNMRENFLVKVGQVSFL